MILVNHNKSICHTLKYWYQSSEEMIDHEKIMKKDGFRYTSTKYGVKKVKGCPGGFQRTYIKYMSIE